MIYVSTGGHRKYSFDKTVKLLSEAGIDAFELSGGVFVKDIEEKLKYISNKYNIALHNYFPPPEKPFVFNLASLDDEITDKSIMHAKFAIDLASLIGSKYYSFHAGYLIDPLVSELGNRITKQVINDRGNALESFIERANALAVYAESKGIKLLVENNVLSRANYDSFDHNPLLMADVDETHEIMNRSHSNLGLLIDVAHLKVSANTLNFSAIDYLNNFYDLVSAYHFSDNLGFEDSNEKIAEDSWFWPYIKTDLDYYSLEVYNQPPSALKNQVELIKRKLS